MKRFFKSILISINNYFPNCESPSDNSLNLNELFLTENRLFLYKIFFVSTNIIKYSVEKIINAIKVILKFTIDNPINIAIIIVIDDINCRAASIAVEVPSILLFKADIMIELFLLV